MQWPRVAIKCKRTLSNWPDKGTYLNICSYDQSTIQMNDDLIVEKFIEFRNESHTIDEEELFRELKPDYYFLV